MKCEFCGKEHNGQYGSGRFCSASCARSFSTSKNRDEINRKRSVALKNTKIYSNGIDTIHIREGDQIPEGYIEGNFSIVQKYSFEEFKNKKLYDNLSKQVERKRCSKKFYIDENLKCIEEHNNKVISCYEEMLKDKANGKTFDISPDVIYAKYNAVMNKTHERSQANRVFVHVLLAETLLGRPLNRFEVVHHKNRDKLDNRFDNIYIFNSKASHARFHYARVFWLRIDKDVLICDKIDADKLRIYMENKK